MTATDRLRALLDERGVKWQDNSDKSVLNTTWNYKKCWFNEFPGRWTVWGMADRGTPEQAVEATLGCGECAMTSLDTGNEAAYEHYEHIMHCKHCHHEFGYVQYNEDGGTWMDEPPRYCPNCGMRVVVE